MSSAPPAEAAEAPATTGLGVALVRSLRPKQWVKNGFVVLPALFGRELDSVQSIAAVIVAVALFCAASSAVYLVNDVLDRAEDRLHPRKRMRAVASGALSVRAALVAAALLFVLAVATSLLLGWLFTVILVAYAGVSLTYSVWLKHEVILDVMGIAAGFVLRVAAGAAAVETEPSVWILICTGLVALMLAFGKRRGEVLALEDAGVNHRRVLGDYSAAFLEMMLLLTAGVTIASYAIYTATPVPAENHLSATLPVVLYGVIRYLWLALYRGEGESPTALIWGDRGLQAAVVVWFVLSAVLIAV